MLLDQDSVEQEVKRLNQDFAHYFKSASQESLHLSTARFEEFTVYRRPTIVIVSDGSSAERGVRA